MHGLAALGRDISTAQGVGACSATSPGAQLGAAGGGGGRRARRGKGLVVQLMGLVASWKRGPAYLVHIKQNLKPKSFWQCIIISKTALLSF